MVSNSRNYRQGLAAAKSGKGIFSQIDKSNRGEHYHRSISLACIFSGQQSQWVLKGRTALVWRDPEARSTRVYVQLGQDNQSTRVKDLVDIVQIALTEVIDGNQLYEALESERLERKLPPYKNGLVCPDSWASAYRSKRLKRGKAPVDYAQTLAIAEALINPAISGEAKGKIWRNSMWC